MPQNRSQHIYTSLLKIAQPCPYTSTLRHKLITPSNKHRLITSFNKTPSKFPNAHSPDHKFAVCSLSPSVQPVGEHVRPAHLPSCIISHVPVYSHDYAGVITTVTPSLLQIQPQGIVFRSSHQQDLRHATSKFINQSPQSWLCLTLFLDATPLTAALCPLCCTKLISSLAS